MNSQPLQNSAHKSRLHRVVRTAVTNLIREQADDGAWHHAFDMGIIPDAKTAIFLHLLGHVDIGWTPALLARIRATQRLDGSWGVYPDAPGDLSTTVGCHYALSLHAGWGEMEQGRTMSEAFIRQAGGPTACRNLTKAILALGGEVSWDDIPAPVIYAWLWSPITPISLWDLVTFTRLHVASMLLLSAHPYRSPVTRRPVMQHLIMARPRHAAQFMRWLHKLPTSSYLLPRCTQFLGSEQEADGTLAGYHSSTFLFLCATNAIEQPMADAEFLRVIAAIRKRWIRTTGDSACLQQACDARVWNTALALRVLRASGLSPDHPTVASGAAYLATRQHKVHWNAYQHAFTGWHETLPTGSALPGALYIRYHLYPIVWPLWALIGYQHHLQGEMKGGEERP